MCFTTWVKTYLDKNFKQMSLLVFDYYGIALEWSLTTINCRKLLNTFKFHKHPFSTLWSVCIQKTEPYLCHLPTHPCPSFYSTKTAETSLLQTVSALCLYCTCACLCNNEAGFMQAWISCEWHWDESSAVNHSDCFMSVVHYQKKDIKEPLC